MNLTPTSGKLHIDPSVFTAQPCVTCSKSPGHMWPALITAPRLIAFLLGPGAGDSSQLLTTPQGSGCHSAIRMDLLLLSPGVMPVLFLKDQKLFTSSCCSVGGAAQPSLPVTTAAPLGLSQVSHTSSAELSCLGQSHDKKPGKTHWQKDAKPLSHLT